ncbi:hypothetical protein ACSU64_05460 [Bacillaceae bacterium C204]|uniref:hypothetical protein n=1 Tax=Neobacillus sp. 204 TaxID=3383351 RepID=UPI00397DF5D2
MKSTKINRYADVKISVISINNGVDCTTSLRELYKIILGKGIIDENYGYTVLELNEDGKR